MWRGETMGSYFLIFNAMLNFDHLDAGSAGKSPAPSSPANSSVSGDNDED
jgi:hypothetical protein